MADVNQQKLERIPDRSGSAVSGFAEEAIRLVKEHPRAALVVALALGWAAGRLLSRR